MSKQTKFILSAAVFALLLAGAIFAHSALMERGDMPDNIVIMDAPDSVLIMGAPEEPTDIPPFLQSALVEEVPAEEASDEPPPEEPPRQLAPDFTMLDEYDNPVMLSDFFGKPIVLNFWTTWCPACVRETPYFSRLFEEYGEDIHILKVNLLDGTRETRDTVDNFMNENGYSFPLFFDAMGEASRAYGVRSIPATFFICAEGYPIARVQGAVNENSLRQGLDAILEG